MVKEYQDWDYCSVHMSVQKPVQQLVEQDVEQDVEVPQDIEVPVQMLRLAEEEAIQDNIETSESDAPEGNTVATSLNNDKPTINEITENEITENAITEHLLSLKNILSNSQRVIQTVSLMKDAVEVTSVEGNIDDIKDDIECAGNFDIDNDVEANYGSSYELSQLVKSDTVLAINNSIRPDQSVDINVFIPSLLLSFESLLKRVFDDLLNGLKNYNLYSMGLAQYLKLEDEQVNGNVLKLRYRLPIDNVKLVFEAMNQ